MGKCFRSADVNQALLLPPSLHDWLPEKHLARFLVDVVDALDLGAIYDSYEEKDGRGQAAYDPAMMVRVLLYGYCTGSYSSRQIEAETYEDLGVRYLAADEHPDHSTLAEFRKRHLEALAGLFTQALQLCQKAGLVKLGHVAIDGSKIPGNASKHKAMSSGHMSEAEKKLQAEVEGLLQRAAAVDAAEDEKYGKGQGGDELPAELARRESRVAKIGAAKAELEAEAKQKAEVKKAAAEAQIEQRREQAARTGKKVSGREPQVVDPEQAVPDPKAQRNFTDPESRIMPDGSHKGSFLQGYNAQIAVDGKAQVIVAAEVTQQSNDKQQLVPMLEQVKKNVGAQPQAASADNGSGTGAVPDAQGDRGTGVRADQRVAWVPTVPAARIAEGASGMETDLSHPQLTQAVPLRESLADVVRNQEGKALHRLRKRALRAYGGKNEVPPVSHFRFWRCSMYLQPQGQACAYVFPTNS